MDRCKIMPWGGIPECQSRLDHKFSKSILFLPFHEAADTTDPNQPPSHRTREKSVAIPVTLENLEAVRTWNAARSVKCDCMFWGPSAFSTSPEKSKSTLILDPFHATTSTHSTSSSYASSESHLSVQIGAGVGNKYLGATVSGKYDRSVKDNQSVSAILRTQKYDLC